jgi:hypothetical protein
MIGELSGTASGLRGQVKSGASCSFDLPQSAFKIVIAVGPTAADCRTFLDFFP